MFISPLDCRVCVYPEVPIPLLFKEEPFFPQLDGQFNVMSGKDIGSFYRDCVLYHLRSTSENFIYLFFHPFSPEAVEAKQNMWYYVPSQFNFSKHHLGCASMIGAVDHL